MEIYIIITMLQFSKHNMCKIQQKIYKNKN